MQTTIDPSKIGEIIRRYRIHMDMSQTAFAATIGRTISFAKLLERSGRTSERSWAQIEKRFPELKKRIVEEVGTFPPKFAQQNPQKSISE